MVLEFGPVIPILPAIAVSVAVFLALVGYRISTIEKGLIERYEKTKNLEVRVDAEVKEFFESIRTNTKDPTVQDLENIASRVSVVKELQSRIELMMGDNKSAIKYDLGTVFLVVGAMPIGVALYPGELILWYLIVAILIGGRLNIFWTLYNQYAEIGKKLVTQKSLNKSENSKSGIA